MERAGCTARWIAIGQREHERQRMENQVSGGGGRRWIRYADTAEAGQVTMKGHHIFLVKLGATSKTDIPLPIRPYGQEDTEL